MGSLFRYFKQSLPLFQQVVRGDPPPRVAGHLISVTGDLIVARDEIHFDGAIHISKVETGPRRGLCQLRPTV
jgi:hypothetical protein